MFCGLDFGTSNTTLGLAPGGEPRLALLEDEAPTLPSAVFLDFAGSGALVGRAAVEAYVVGEEGRLMRSLKSLLGTDLIDETTQVGRGRVSFRDVVVRFLAETKRRAEEQAGRELTCVVQGRPVRFTSGDETAERLAEEDLRDIVEQAGFEEISFQFEPVAAALDHERSLAREEVALVADIGGGTSDFSVVRLGPGRASRADRRSDVLANDGVRIGGTDFDRDLALERVMPLLGFRTPMRKAGLDVPSGYYFDLATWSKVNLLDARGLLRELTEVRREAVRPELIDRLARVVRGRHGYGLLIAVEGAKIELSERARAQIALDAAEEGLRASVTAEELAHATDGLAAAIAARVRACIRAAGLAPGAIDALFLTGGSTLLPHLRARILAEAPEARVVEGDKFGSVGLGLTIEAGRRYG